MSAGEPTLGELLEDAIGLFEVGRTIDAVQRLDLILQRDDLYAEAWYYRGRCMQQAGDLGEALRCFRAAADVAPDYAAAHCEIGLCLNDMGRYAEALPSFAEALKLMPEMHAALINSGYSYERLERFDEAAACYREVLARDPLNAAAWLNLGSSLLASGKPREALECFEDAYDLAESGEFKAKDQGIDINFFKDRANLGITRCRELLDGR
jgi:tetratricopeptide (TPR) repeat protein